MKRVLTNELYDFVKKELYLPIIEVKEELTSKGMLTETLLEEMNPILDSTKSIEQPYVLSAKANESADLGVFKTYVENIFTVMSNIDNLDLPFESAQYIKSNRKRLYKEYLSILELKPKTVGMFGGKFNLHNGHIYAIMQASTMVDELYVVVSYIEERDKELANQAGIKYANPKLRALWITQATSIFQM